MGCVENITYDEFPQQKGDLGTKVNLGLNGDRVIPAVVVRSDAEFPNIQIFRTSEGMYILGTELEHYKLPKQGSFLGRGADVCFHYDTTRTLEGKIVRDDIEEPYLGLIHLKNGRVILTGECQYHPVDNEVENEDEEQEPTEIAETVAARDIESIKRQLKRKDYSKRVKLLQGIYHQLVPSRNGKLGNGEYNQRYSIFQKEHQHFVSSKEFNEDTITQLLNQIDRSIDSQKFASFLAEEMSKYEHLQNHAARLQEAYSGNLHVNFPKGLKKPIQIRTI